MGLVLLGKAALGLCGKFGSGAGNLNAPPAKLLPGKLPSLLWSESALFGLLNMLLVKPTGSCGDLLAIPAPAGAEDGVTGFWLAVVVSGLVKFSDALK